MEQCKDLCQRCPNPCGPNRCNRKYAHAGLCECEACGMAKIIRENKGVLDRLAHS